MHTSPDQIENVTGGETAASMRTPESVAGHRTLDEGEFDHDLWMIHAMIQPFKLDDVTLALESIAWFGGMTVLECRGFGREKIAADAESRYQSDERDVQDFTAKLLLQVAVAGRSHAHTIVRTISTAAHTGQRGDGKVFAWPLTHVVRVRTGEEGSDAL